MSKKVRDFLRKVKGTISDYGMISAGDKVLIAVSGGPDSMALLRSLDLLKEELDITLHIAHLDHRFRGEESAEDARFVAETAHRLEIPITIEEIDVPKFIEERGLSEEEGARRVRYEFLNRTADAVRASKIALGHTADDQAETVLMRLIRGSGTRGLSGIPPVRSGRFIRPLIRIGRKEIEEFLLELGQDYRIDSTNLKPIYIRNRIRLELVPLLARYNPNISSVLARTGEILAAEDELLSQIADDELTERLSERGQGYVRFSIVGFEGLHVALRRRIVRRAIEMAKGNLLGIDLSHISSVLQMISGEKPNAEVDLPGVRVEKRYSQLVATVHPREDKPRYEYRLDLPGEVVIPEAGVRLIAEVRDERPELPVSEEIAVLDLERLSSPLIVRNRRPGDRFRPLGMKGSKKLKDFLIERKVPIEERDKVPILISDGEIAWVVGYRVDERFKMRDETRRFAVIWIERL
ncbi:TPA: tRNA lysidine(34) synthetase TilS [Candidatus Poribacteria bacterium]|nr:tRNA lysidine(34) synthetase TilS [Candidatus Poribacteria bacterium]